MQLRLQKKQHRAKGQGCEQEQRLFLQNRHRSEFPKEYPGRKSIPGREDKIRTLHKKYWIAPQLDLQPGYSWNSAEWKGSRPRVRNQGFAAELWARANRLPPTTN